MHFSPSTEPNCLNCSLRLPVFVAVVDLCSRRTAVFNAVDAGECIRLSLVRSVGGAAQVAEWGRFVVH